MVSNISRTNNLILNVEYFNEKFNKTSKYGQ